VTRTLYVLRHGERPDDLNPTYGTTAPRSHDPPLTGIGVGQARATGRWLRAAGARVDRVFASPFCRAVHTAEHVVRGLSGDGAGPADDVGAIPGGTTRRVEPLPVRVEDGLCEHLNPDWFDERPATMDRGTLAERFPSVRLDHESVVEPRYPESGEEAAARAGETARRLLDATEGTLLLVGHGLTVGGIVEGLVGPDDRIAAPYCGLSRLHRDATGWDLTYSGRRTYEEPVPEPDGRPAGPATAAGDD
jgi:broad specificity phosphatase PhoE